MEVLIDDRQSRYKLPKQIIRRTARRILNALDYPDAQLSILIVDDVRIAELNQAYLNHTGPTNVISFPMQEGEFSDIAPEVLGDVVISADTAHREAVDAGMQLRVRFDQLLIHGILHLVGFDHVHSQEDAILMEEKSNQLMELIHRKD